MANKKNKNVYETERNLPWKYLKKLKFLISVIHKDCECVYFFHPVQQHTSDTRMNTDN